MRGGLRQFIGENDALNKFLNPIPPVDEDQIIEEREEMENMLRNIDDDDMDFDHNPPENEPFFIPNPVERVNPFGKAEVRAVRGGKMVIDQDGRGIPGGINPPPAFRKLAEPRFPRKVKEPEPKEYPLNGVIFKGIKFSRELNFHERIVLANCGFMEVINRFPDLLFKEKPLPINEKEERVFVVAELVDFLATASCKELITKFDIKLHNDEYQSAYKKYLKLVASLK